MGGVLVSHKEQPKPPKKGALILKDGYKGLPKETLELERLERAGDRGALCKAEETMELEKLPSTPILQVPEADESVAEQPHTTSPTDLQALGEDAIEAAMDNLEAYVLKATEAALKGSRAAIEKALQEKSTLLMLTEQSWLQAQAKVRPSRPSLQALHQVVGDNLFEKRRRVSEKDELRKGQDSPAKPPTKPRRRSRMATGLLVLGTYLGDLGGF